jgi:hypothetical protein
LQIKKRKNSTNQVGNKDSKGTNKNQNKKYNTYNPNHIIYLVIRMQQAKFYINYRNAKLTNKNKIIPIN